MGFYYGGFPPYVPVAERRKQAERQVAKLAKKGRVISPVKIEGRAIARTFWGKAWCDNLETYSDFANRLPRGRTYVRNGSVIDLQIEPGQVSALVSGSTVYSIKVDIKALAPDRWARLVAACAGKIDSLVELLQGKLSKGVLEVLTDRTGGLFPAPGEIELRCSCPDGAYLCKHLAATLYGVGARLDEQPDLFFTLRRVDKTELIARAGEGGSLGQAAGGSKRRLAPAADLSSVFGIDLDDGSVTAQPPPRAAGALAKGLPRASGAKAAPAPKPARAKAAPPADVLAPAASAPKPARAKAAPAAPKPKPKRAEAGGAMPAAGIVAAVRAAHGVGGAAPASLAAPSPARRSSSHGRPRRPRP